MAITKRQYADKAIRACGVTFAAAADEPTLLMGGHGRIVCVCGRIIAACPHIGHQQLLYDTRPNCDACVETGSVQSTEAPPRPVSVGDG